MTNQLAAHGPSKAEHQAEYEADLIVTTFGNNMSMYSIQGLPKHTESTIVMRI
jgi:hypothetical protein